MSNIKTLSGAGIASGIIMVLALGTTANAAVAVDSDGKIKLYGDMRYRVEADTRTDDGAEDRSRDRSRFRARLGVKYAPNDDWSGDIRLATNASNNQSPHQTFGTVDASDNAKFGIDRARIIYSGVPNLTLVGGKTSINFWQQSELFWDTDIGAEAFAAIYKAGPVTFNAAYTVLADMGWEESNTDATAITYQAVYGADLSGVKLTVAVGGATLDNVNSMDGNATSIEYESESHMTASVQVKTGPFLVGIDYLTGDADDENTAFLAQVRYKINDMFGVRAHYYDVGRNATLLEGAITQDDFPTSTDFTGFQLQLDIKAAKNTSIDLRYFSQEEKEVAAGADAWTKTRAQANINVKF